MLTVQQQLVLDNLAGTLKSSLEATDKMRTRASTLFAASAGLMSFVSAGEFIGKGNAIQSAFVAASILAGVFVAIRSIGLYLPRERTTPGNSSDAEKIRDEYLDVTEDQAVNQIISDRASCFVDARKVNSCVGFVVRQMAFGFVVQVICVAGAVITRVFSVPT